MHPSRAHADETPLPAQLGEVSVTASPETRDAPSAFSTVILPRDHDTRFTTVPELVAQTAGVFVRDLAGPGQFSTVSIRGSSAEQVSVYLDGVRLNTAGLGAVDMATLPTSGIERIEVLRGGGTAQFGSDAIGGVIHLVTAKGRPGRTADAAVTGGSFLTLKTAAHFAARADRHDLLLAHSHFQSRGNYTFRQATSTLAGAPVSGGGIFRRDHNRVLADDLLCKVDVRADEQTQVNVTNDLFWTDRQIPGTEAEATLLAPINPLEATHRIVRNLTHVGVRFADLWTPRLDLALGIQNVLEYARFGDHSPALGPPIARATWNDALGPYFRWNYAWPTPTGTHALTTRYDYRRDMFADRAGNTTTATTGARGRDVHQFLLQDEWRSSNERVTIVPAARFADASDFSADLDGKLGVRIAPVAPLTFKANLESTHRTPTFSELYYPDEGYLRGNPDLAKEAAINWDTGAALAWKRARIEGAYFQQRIRNSILFVPISATTIQPINTFAVRAEGIEASGEATPWPFVRLVANYTWLKARFASTGLQLPGRPRHAANLRVELFKEFSPRWGGRVFADTQWTGRLPVNVANTVFLAARTTLDVGGTATFTTARGTRYFATLEAKDVTNVQAYDARGFPLPRRAFFLTVGAKWS